GYRPHQRLLAGGRLGRKELERKHRFAAAEQIPDPHNPRNLMESARQGQSRSFAVVRCPLSVSVFVCLGRGSPAPNNPTDNRKRTTIRTDVCDKDSPP